MNRYTIYILYSQKLDKYYIGYTSIILEDRIRRHLTDHSGFSAKAKDLVVVYQIQYKEKDMAIKEEKRIKKRGAKRFLMSAED